VCCLSCSLARKRPLSGRFQGVIQAQTGPYAAPNLRSSSSNIASPRERSPRDCILVKCASASCCASATVAHSSISLFTLMLRLLARSFKRLCLLSGNRMVMVDLAFPSSAREGEPLAGARQPSHVFGGHENSPTSPGAHQLKSLIRVRSGDARKCSGTSFSVPLLST
jgi:hypothetical protein